MPLFSFATYFAPRKSLVRVGYYGKSGKMAKSYKIFEKKLIYMRGTCDEAGVYIYIYVSKKTLKNATTATRGKSSTLTGYILWQKMRQFL